MTNKQELRSTSERDWFEDWFKREFHPDKTGPYIKDQLLFAVRAARAPLLDELEAKDRRNAELNSTLERWAADRAQSASELDDADKQIAELSHHLKSAHEFIEHTEAFGHEASNGILCCGDAQWYIDASKLALAAAGKGE